MYRHLVPFADSLSSLSSKVNELGSATPAFCSSPLGSSVSFVLNIFQAPLRSTMPDHMHFALAGQGDTRSQDWNVFCFASVMIRSYLRSPQEALDQVPAGSPLGAGGEATGGALCVGEGVTGVGVAVTTTSVSGGVELVVEEQATTARPHHTSQPSTNLPVRAITMLWSETYHAAESFA